MAITNQERIRRGMELLREGLVPFVEREMRAKFKEEWFLTMRDSVSESQAENLGTESNPKYDSRTVLAVLWNQWTDVFRLTLGPSERSIVSELRGVGNKLAHEEAFSGDDTYRALDSMERLLLAVSALESEEVGRMKQELLRLRFDEQVRNEKKKESRGAVESSVTGVLKPWREVISPHKDVASGRYEQAEFAADLWQVYLGGAEAEYQDPVEFFRRTFMTESLGKLLTDAIRRLSGQGGDPVVQLQTNFGGGKTHSMLALYHLVSGRRPGELYGVDPLLQDSGCRELPAAKVVVLVGNKLHPGSEEVKADGTVVRTIWGELAYQLGGAAAYQRVKDDDLNGTSPGDKLRELMAEYGPCLILIDEWVSLARQLPESPGLPGGTFEAQFSFAQALTESAKLVKNCLLVISLPASDTASSPHATSEDIEVGGLKGREALERLRNVIGRVESSWRPASAEEGFEIVRRRLFEPIIDPEQFRIRDYVSRSFYDLYRTQHQEFPPECRDADYEERIRAAYPIHPEVFDRLYTDWSTLAKFQRTRGVLRLMAAVIHSLWTKGDRNPLILPCNIPIEDNRVQFELTRYLPDQWEPILTKDVDGPGALPLRIDGELSSTNVGKYQACRRVARTIYLGSAPTASAANRGIEDRRIKLGCAMPGEQPAIFGDALRRLAGAATYLYQDGPRYWYSTQPTVTKLAEDRAEQLKRDSDKVARELERRVKRDLAQPGDFSRIHAFPQSGADVPDDYDARLVVIGTEHPYSKDGESMAETFATEILRSRGNTPRLYQNTPVFLAVDTAKLQDLDEATRRFLAWESILSETTILNLDPHQVRQAEQQRAGAESAVSARIPEAFQWLLVPTQMKPEDSVELKPYRLTGQDPLAVRASKKLRNDELLLTSFAPSRLRMALDGPPSLWEPDQNHVAVAKVVEYFARYIYLPRIKTAGLLLNAIQEGIRLLTWQADSFAYADSFDEQTNRYRGLVAGRLISLGGGIPTGLLVRAEVAAQQLAAETPPSAPTTILNAPPAMSGDPADGLFIAPPPAATEKKLNRYHGTVSLDASRVGRDAGRIADEVISHLVGIVGANVRVTLEIEAQIDAGASPEVVRIVTQNGCDLKFTSHGFESD